MRPHAFACLLSLLSSCALPLPSALSVPEPGQTFRQVGAVNYTEIYGLGTYTLSATFTRPDAPQAVPTLPSSAACTLVPLESTPGTPRVPLEAGTVRLGGVGALEHAPGEGYQLTLKRRLPEQARLDIEGSASGFPAFADVTPPSRPVFAPRLEGLTAPALGEASVLHWDGPGPLEPGVERYVLLYGQRSLLSAQKAPSATQGFYCLGPDSGELRLPRAFRSELFGREARAVSVSRLARRVYARGGALLAVYSVQTVLF